MNKLLYATAALIISIGVYKVSAQQTGTVSPQMNGTQSSQMGPPEHRGPPPNVTQAIALLDQAKQQSNTATAALITQAETLLTQPPPHPNAQGGMGKNGQMGQMQAPPPQ